jgi:hypothetical protein
LLGERTDAALEELYTTRGRIEMNSFRQVWIRRAASVLAVLAGVLVFAAVAPTSSASLATDGVIHTNN